MKEEYAESVLKLSKRHAVKEIEMLGCGFSEEQINYIAASFKEIVDM